MIDDSAAPSVLEIRAKCRRLKAENRLDMVVIDYLQLIRGERLGREPGAGDLADHACAQGARQGARRADHRAVAALARGRDTRRRPQAAALGSS